VPITQLAPSASKAPPIQEVTKEELMETLKTFDERCQQSDELIHLRKLKIATLVLEHLNKGIERRLINIHSNYSSMFDAIRKFDSDKEVSIPLMDTWIPSF